MDYLQENESDKTCVQPINHDISVKNGVNLFQLFSDNNHCMLLIREETDYWQLTSGDNNSKPMSDDSDYYELSIDDKDDFQSTSCFQSISNNNDYDEVKIYDSANNQLVTAVKAITSK